jgi:hypothetical protein
LVAVSPMLNVPIWDGVPLSSPVCVLTLIPAGDQSPRIQLGCLWQRFDKLTVS